MVEKGKSPFYPGQPVPAELFVGRSAEINRIVDQGITQVVLGKPQAIFVEGDYGIGKSSIASLTQYIGEQSHGLLQIYVTLGAAKSMDDVAARILEATVRAGAFDPNRSEKIKHWLAKYIGDQELWGVSVKLDALRQDAPQLKAGLLPFFSQALDRLRETGIRGIFLVLDEINGISSNPDFAHFIKSLVDENAVAKQQVPLLLMLCGTGERRREMIQHHQPVDRIFQVIPIDRMSDTESRDFFVRAFESVNMKVEEPELRTMVHYSAGFPKIMHEIGDAMFWVDSDGKISQSDVITGVTRACDEIGKKYVDQQVFKALRSPDYQAILRKIGGMANVDGFMRADVIGSLDGNEKRKFDNFVQRMKQLNVIRSGQKPGEYLFNMRMVGLYIYLESDTETGKLGRRS